MTETKNKTEKSKTEKKVAKESVAASIPAVNTSVPLIFRQMAKVMRDTASISKSRDNKEQKYKFRGIDDVYNALHEPLAKHGIVTIPNVRSLESSQYKSRSGAAMISRIIEVEYKFIAEDGSSLSAIVFGEGFDSGDKSTNKAMSGAHKYALLQVFCIPTGDPKDSENESPQIADDAKKEKPQTQRRTTTQRAKSHDRRSAAPSPPVGFSEPTENDIASLGPPPSKFDTAVRMDIRGKDQTISYGEALALFGKAKKFVGADLYYEVLNRFGFAKADKIPNNKMNDVYLALVDAYNEK